MELLQKILGALALLACLGAPSAAAATTDHFSEHFVLRNGAASLYVEVAGKEGAPVLLYLHGGPGNVVLGLLPFQHSVGARLEQDYRVAYLHQRGAGKSSPVPLAGQTVAAYVADVASVVGELQRRYGVDSVHLAGHSWGGMLAVIYAAQQEPLPVTSLTLIATGMNVEQLLEASFRATWKWAVSAQVQPAKEALSAIGASDEGVTGDANQLVLAEWASRANGGIARNLDVPAFLQAHDIPKQYPQARQHQRQVRDALFREFVALDLYPQLGSLNLPVLFVAGARDTIAPPGLLELARHAHPGRDQWLLLEDSHHLPFVDEPEALARAMSGFMARAE